MLFVEDQSPRGVFMLCSGRVKLSTCSREGRTLILHIAEPGEMLGLSATLSGEPYEVTAETLDPCQVNYIKRDELMRFLAEHQDACFRVAQLLSNSYHNAFSQIRSLALSNSCAEKLARLLLDWSARGEATKQGIRIRMGVTHEEIAQMIGTSRETVTRLLGDFRTRQFINLRGSSLVICNKPALESIVTR
jgi:CRP/FNR family transcriptional regulator